MHHKSIAYQRLQAVGEYLGNKTCIIDLIKKVAGLWTMWSNKCVQDAEQRCANMLQISSWVSYVIAPRKFKQTMLARVNIDTSTTESLTFTARVSGVLRRRSLIMKTDTPKTIKKTPGKKHVSIIKVLSHIYSDKPYSNASTNRETREALSTWKDIGIKWGECSNAIVSIFIM